MDVKRLPLVDPEDWVVAAACRGNQVYFFPPDDEVESKVEKLERESKAKEICSGCAVQVECLTDALGSREKFGIWGGMTERERRSYAARAISATPHDVAGPGRLARLPAVVVQGPAMSSSGGA